MRSFSTEVNTKSNSAQAGTIIRDRAETGAATVPPFNKRGVFTNPSFILARPSGPKGQIEFSVKAHGLAGDCWIAEPSWYCTAGHAPGHSQQPSCYSQTFQTRSEAVDDAISRGLRQISAELGPMANAASWKSRMSKLRAWAADALAEVRANDETLPLRGIQVIDLACGGLGGFGIGLSSLGATIQLACDIDANARAIYQKNVRPLAMHDDLCSLDGKALRCDILTIGLMGKAFSRAGKGLGLRDPNLTRAYLHSLRLLEEIDAKVVILECVRQLLTVNGGQDAQVFRDVLLKAGYRIQQRVLNAKGFGLPQDRERVFVVATRIGLACDQLTGYLFPNEQAPDTVVADIMDDYVPAEVGGAKIHWRKCVPATRQTRKVEVGRIGGRDAQGYRVYSPMGLGATLTARGGGCGQTSVYSVNGKARTLTAREAGRMQGLPEWAEHHSVKTQAWIHAGNAVAIPLVRELARSLAATLTTTQASANACAQEGGAA